MSGPEKHVAEAEVEPLGKDLAVGDVLELVGNPVYLSVDSSSLDADQIFRRMSRTRSFQTRSFKSVFMRQSIVQQPLICLQGSQRHRR